MKAMHGFQAAIAQVLVRYGEVPTGGDEAGSTVAYLAGRESARISFFGRNIRASLRTLSGRRQPARLYRA